MTVDSKCAALTQPGSFTVLSCRHYASYAYDIYDIRGCTLQVSSGCHTLYRQPQLRQHVIRKCTCQTLFINAMKKHQNVAAYICAYPYPKYENAVAARRSSPQRSRPCTQRIAPNNKTQRPCHAKSQPPRVSTYA